MTDNPYANLASEGLDPVPQRTSVLAILALVIAIISIVPLFCLLPASGAVAVIFGGAALMFIHRERGRLSGTGLAATAIVLGLLVTVAQIVVLVVASRTMQVISQAVAEPVRASMTALEAGDLATARKLFPPATDEKITDEMLQTFVTNYQAQAGNFTGFPTSMLSVGRTYMEVIPGMQALQGRNDGIPLPGLFTKSNALIVLIFDEKTSQGQNSSIAARNLAVITPTGKAVWLLDPALTPPPTWGQGPGTSQGTTVEIGPGGVKVTPPPQIPPPPATPEPGGSVPAEPEKPASDEPVEPAEPAKPDEPS